MGASQWIYGLYEDLSGALATGSLLLPRLPIAKAPARSPCQPDTIDWYMRLLSALTLILILILFIGGYPTYRQLVIGRAQDDIFLCVFGLSAVALRYNIVGPLNVLGYLQSPNLI